VAPPVQSLFCFSVSRLRPSNFKVASMGYTSLSDDPQFYAVALGVLSMLKVGQKAVLGYYSLYCLQ
jgi:hypothetical protein